MPLEKQEKTKYINMLMEEAVLGCWGRGGGEEISSSKLEKNY